MAFRFIAMSTTRHLEYATKLAEYMGMAIRIARLERQLTLQELAAEIGCSRELVARVEKGSPAQSLGIVLQLLGYLDVELRDLGYANVQVQSVTLAGRLKTLPRRRPVNRALPPADAVD